MIKKFLLSVSTFAIIISPLFLGATAVEAAAPFVIAPPCHFRDDIATVNKYRGHHPPTQTGYTNNQGYAVDMGSNGKNGYLGEKVINLLTGTHYLEHESCRGFDAIAPFDGIIYRYFDGPDVNNPYIKKGGGWTVEINNPTLGLKAKFLHLAPDNISPANGNRVTKGQKIGTLGNTGNSYGTHLHFELCRATASYQDKCNLKTRYSYHSYTDNSNRAEQWYFGTEEPVAFNNVSSVVFNGLLVQSVVDQQQRVNTRYFNGTTWSAWVNNSGMSDLNVNTVVLPQVAIAVQSVRGVGGNDIYTRYTTDGQLWNEWYKDIGQTKSEITSIEFNGTIFQAIRGTDNLVYYRKFSNQQLTNWTFDEGATKGPVTMAVYNGRLYQAVIGVDDYVWYRSSADGNKWSGWTFDGGAGKTQVSMIVYNNKLIQGLRGVDDQSYIRSFDGNSWTPWINLENTITKGNLTMAVYQNKLFISLRDASNLVRTRIIDGDKDSGWILSGASLSDVNMIEYQGKLYQTVMGVDNKVWFRTFDGKNWSEWTI